MIHEIRVAERGRDTRGADLLQEIKALGIEGLTQVRASKIYRLEGISPQQAESLAQGILCDRQTQTFTMGDGDGANGAQHHLEVAYRPGVMNPEVASIMKVAHDRGMQELMAADSSWEYRFFGSVTDGEMQTIIDLLVNKAVQHVVAKKPTTLRIDSQPGCTQNVPVTTLGEEELDKMSQSRSLFLKTEEMQVIQRYFQQLGREPTDVELETLAQTWSEHCGHKTFKAALVVDGKTKEPLIKRLMETAKRHFGDRVLSAFVDNSGVIAFYEEQAVCAKVETHNSPSAIDPYGGANTGLGGVIRDPNGTGQGAKPLLCTNMFCFARPDLPTAELPPGCLHPRYLVRNVVAGVRDYGNRMGIPTTNGSVHFHPDFRAKPTVICGCYAILPAEKCQKGKPQPGDVIVAVGGRTGRDGIHGATFSSGEMTDKTMTVNAQAVQIGNAIEEKRMVDALLQCRDEGLIRAITDCGAGGFASAIGEMGAKTGVQVELEKAPLKYQGLAPWEIWVSESQERMVLAVAPGHVERVLEICCEYNVEATTLGIFTDTQRLLVTFNGDSVCDLSMEFLHDGLPQRTMVARKRQEAVLVSHSSVSELKSDRDWTHTYREVMAHGNVCSKEPIVRMYDHTVQGTSVLLPFSGAEQDGPNDASVIRPILGKPYGMVVSHGLNPILNRIDPYAGSVWAAVEALANYVVVGGNFREAALIDNFIWPFPDEESLWDLDQAVEACCTIMDIFGIPFVSGKDSLSSTYRRGDFVLKIPPVLCVSAFGRIPDVSKTVTADFKQRGSNILLVGKLDTDSLGGSAYLDAVGHTGGNVPRADLLELPRLFDWLHGQIVEGNVLACHDISEGGMAATLAEMCFGGNRGADVTIPSEYIGRLDNWFFCESAGCFLIEVPRERTNLVLLSALRAGTTSLVAQIGTVTDTDIITLTHRNTLLFSLTLDALKESWKQPMEEVFH